MEKKMKNDHRALLLIVFVGLTTVLCQGCDSVYRKYVNHSDSYSIELPISWKELGKVNEEMNGMISSGTIFQKIRFKISPSRFKGARMVLTKHQRITENLYNSPNYYLNYLMSDSKINNRGQIDLKEGKAEWILAQREELMGKEIRENAFGKEETATYVTTWELAYLIKKDDTIFYVILFQTLEEDYDAYINIFEKIAKSFKLLK